MKVRIVGNDGKPQNTDIFDGDTGEKISRVQRVTIDTHVDKPYATCVLEVAPFEFDMVAYVEKVKIGYEWFYPAHYFYGPEKEYTTMASEYSEEWIAKEEKIGGLTIGYSEALPRDENTGEVYKINLNDEDSNI